MLDVYPLISLQAFIIGFIVVLMSIALFADIYVSKQEKARRTRQRPASANKKAIQHYYNTYRKGA